MNSLKSTHTFLVFSYETSPYERVASTVDEAAVVWRPDAQAVVWQITELATEYGDIAYWWFDHVSSIVIARVPQRLDK